jgi:hypothetical protein
VFKSYCTGVVVKEAVLPFGNNLRTIHWSWSLGKSEVLPVVNQALCREGEWGSGDHVYTRSLVVCTLCGLPPPTQYSTDWIRGWVNPRTGRDVVMAAKRKILPLFGVKS